MDWNAKYIEEWRQLGFYYDCDDELKQWRLIGSKKGFSNLIDHLFNYAKNPNKAGISEHIHLGPHQYLKIITWHKPEIKKDYIGGSLNDIKQLGQLFEQKVNETETGNTFIIGSDYSNESNYIIKCLIMDEAFESVTVVYADKKNKSLTHLRVKLNYSYLNASTGSSLDAFLAG